MMYKLRFIVHSIEHLPTPEQFANFKQKWNAGTDPEIKKLKRHYDLDFKTGALTAKKR